MREPSLSIHGIEGAFSGAGAKTVIPAKVSGKFSIRLVPPQTPEAIDPLVIEHLKSGFSKLGSKNTLTVENLHGGKPWMADHRHWNFEAAKKATKVCQTNKLAYAMIFKIGEGRVWTGPGFDSRGWIHSCHFDLCRVIGRQRIVASDGSWR